jgi:hypothetical protein
MPRRLTFIQRVLFQIQQQRARDATVEESALLEDTIRRGGVCAGDIRADNGCDVVGRGPDEHAGGG